MSMHPGKPTDEEQDSAAEAFYGVDENPSPASDRAVHQEEWAGWKPLTADSLPTGRVLVTNNLAARDTNGDMSHIWIATPMVSSEPESAGEIVSFDDDFVKLRGLKYWHPLPSDRAVKEPE